MPEATMLAADPNVWHVVGRVQHVLHVLRLRTPRALCGASLIAADGEPDLPTDDAPECSACAALNPRRRNAVYDAAQDVLDRFRGDPESDEFHRLNDAAHDAKRAATWARRNRWTGGGSEDAR